ncbi:FAD-dependent oxidoreductase domain-containing protein 1 isoform X3 [Mobula birostris]|uniref:FAD-dependent oxidoreductase domain-containing protein 1 isoform X3 n=1 Tax=Mobula birostris TaxID=1983395 RepID=UPI003B2887F2
MFSWSCCRTAVRGILDSLPVCWHRAAIHCSVRVWRYDDFFKDLENEFAKFKHKVKEALPGSDWSPLHQTSGLPPEWADVVIIGGGVVGWSTAYWLKKKEAVREGVRVVVVERDPTYSRSSTVLSVGGIRQQFSLPENIHLSIESARFLRNIQEHLNVVNEDPVDIHFNPSGYLFLAGKEQSDILAENYNIQRHCLLWSQGAAVTLLTPQQLQRKFPWINTDGIALASYGLENEGWFDPWLLLNAFRRKAISMGVHQCHGEVVGFQHSTRDMEADDGSTISLKRIHHVIEEEPDCSDLEVSYEYFDEEVWPKLAQRVPAFESLKLKTAWAGYYDYNTFDQNAVIGIHPLVTNMFFATGFSGHGLQQSPAVGRAMAELILDGRFKTLDLSVFDFIRFYRGTKVLEKNIV